jgi:hypothetical protein
MRAGATLNEYKGRRRLQKLCERLDWIEAQIGELKEKHYLIESEIVQHILEEQNEK